MGKGERRRQAGWGGLEGLLPSSNQPQAAFNLLFTAGPTKAEEELLEETLPCHREHMLHVSAEELVASAELFICIIAN